MSQCVGYIFRNQCRILLTFSMSVVTLPQSVYSWIKLFCYCDVEMGISYSKIQIVVSYQLGIEVMICVFKMLSVISWMAPISFSQKLISWVKYLVSISFGNGREVPNFCQTWVQPTFVKVLSRQSLSATDISMRLSVFCICVRKSSPHLRCISAFTLLAWTLVMPVF